jgi:FKBP-type peptidyl-prolyl cis-trans isomerase
MNYQKIVTLLLIGSTLSVNAQQKTVQKVATKVATTTVAKPAAPKTTITAKPVAAKAIQVAKPVVNLTKSDGTHDHHHGAEKPMRTLMVEYPKTGLTSFVWHNESNLNPKFKENDMQALHGRLYDDASTTVLNDFGFNPQVPITKQSFGFMYEGVLRMAAGDSAVLRVSADSLFGKNLPPQIKAGDFVRFSFASFTKEEGEIKAAKLKAEMEAKQREAEANKMKQLAEDEATLKSYFTSHNITNAIRTEDGLYYVISQAGTGAIPQAGETVVANYRGKGLDGVIFDSNMDSAFNHMQPFEFPVGQGRVIQGWDKGFSMFKKGTKATLYIPSTLAYGANGAGDRIKPNSCLIFDVELVDIKAAPKQEQAQPMVTEPINDEATLLKYFADNKITNYQRTAEGLYYVITKQGTGATPQAGQNVTANYTGKLLDGKVFDSNVLPENGHVQPFEFPVGQGRVIQGWDKGFMLFNKGTKATLYIPSKLAYGAGGAGELIKPNSCLIFDVELVDFK